MTYDQRLLQTKELYPFTRWRKAYDHGLEQYTAENCDRVKQVFDTLIEELIALGETAPEEDKINRFESAIMTLNDLNFEIDGLIETGEREDLCALIDEITVAAGLDPADYGDGQGMSDEWRDW
jgi:hypothetical protein